MDIAGGKKICKRKLEIDYRLDFGRISGLVNKILEILYQGCSRLLWRRNF
ncbi:hypothetical protein Lalb_Chr21g0309521 [Lupinus albus]|uniref:Uncharacterized protein n=1 Tax=Lupinus albus TaxID=3870 RepID=A0A6A4NSE5_LUPAL|nr:hypothetical protein Lalb_Chr21g0309521 [Lupinus albus]